MLIHTKVTRLLKEKEKVEAFSFNMRLFRDICSLRQCQWASEQVGKDVKNSSGFIKTEEYEQYINGA